MHEGDQIYKAIKGLSDANGTRCDYVSYAGFRNGLGHNFPETTRIPSRREWPQKNVVTMAEQLLQDTDESLVLVVNGKLPDEIRPRLNTHADRLLVNELGSTGGSLEINFPVIAEYDFGSGINHSVCSRDPDEWEENSTMFGPYGKLSTLIYPRKPTV